MEKSFEFFSLDDHLKETIRKGPEYQVAKKLFFFFTFDIQLIFQGVGSPGKGDT